MSVGEQEPLERRNYRMTTSVPTTGGWEFPDVSHATLKLRASKESHWGQLGLAAIAQPAPT